MRVVCIKCERNELLSKALNEIGCEGCRVEGKQGNLFEGRNNRSDGQW